MRRKKHKHSRRAVRFYKVNCGFREPYKVLMDGNIVHSMLHAGMKEASELIGKLLGAQVRLFTTRCVMQELQGLGEDFAETHAACKQIQLYKCNHHGSPVTAGECLRELVGSNNQDHFFVGTQDRQLRADIGKVPSGASLFVSVNGLHLEQPSEKQLKAAGQAQSDAAQPSATELKSKALAELPEAQRERARQEAANLSIYRRQKAKGPNPLAAKPKQTSRRQQPEHQVGSAQQAVPKRARKRRKLQTALPGAASH